METLNKYRLLTDNFIDNLSKENIVPKKFKEALFYTPKSGGKRIRALLTFSSAEMFNADIDKVVFVAAAIELIHAYSLIHDDLPAMDNDDFRRGKPSNHKVFGEDMAILAGDGLNTHAFNVIADSPLMPEQKIEIIKHLSKAAGIYGMVNGQAADILSSGADVGKNQQKKLVNFIHKHKTAKLIQSSVVCGALCGRNIKDTDFNKISKYGLYIGVAFQIIDDCLDIVGDEKLLGKKKVDEINNTLTYPKIYGLERSYKMAEVLKNMAFNEIKDMKKSENLINIAKLVVERKQ